MEEQHRSGTERIAFEAAVESLARSQGLDVEEVQSLYESILAEMKREAIITDFLPIFAARKVKDMLHLKGSSAAT